MRDPSGFRPTNYFMNGQREVPSGGVHVTCLVWRGCGCSGESANSALTRCDVQADSCRSAPAGGTWDYCTVAASVANETAAHSVLNRPGFHHVATPEEPQPVACAGVTTVWVESADASGMVNDGR